MMPSILVGQNTVNLELNHVIAKKTMRIFVILRMVTMKHVEVVEIL